jgi:hypothetical protein
VAIKDLKAQLECQTVGDKDLAALSKKLGAARSALQDLRDTVESSARWTISHARDKPARLTRLSR